jgi:hypothetical protein
VTFRNISYKSTTAIWLNFRSNNSKVVQQNLYKTVDKKIGGHKTTNLSKKWQKKGLKIFFNCFFQIFWKEIRDIYLQTAL